MSKLGLKEVIVFVLVFAMSFTMFNYAINTAYSQQVQVDSQFRQVKTMALNTSGATIAAYQAVVIDATNSVAKNKLCFKTTTTADDPLFLGYTEKTVDTGEVAFLITKGIATAECNGTVTAGSALGTATDAGEVDAGTGAGTALETGTDETILVYIP